MCITVIGDAFVDIIIPTADIRRGETYHRPLRTFVGGAPNIAIQISKIGGTVNFIGKLGKDPFGFFIKENLKNEGVTDLSVEDLENPTGLCTSLVSKDGERTMIAMRGSNNHLEKSDLLKHETTLLNSRIIYFSGYSFLSDQNKDSLIPILKKSNQNEIYFNPGSPNIASQFKELIKSYVDVLILNLDESKSLSGETDIPNILSKLRGIVKTTLITLGNEGCILFTDGKYQHVSTNSVKVKDSTGAGDAFVSGFIIGRTKGFDLETCAKMGNKVALSFLLKKNDN